METEKYIETFPLMVTMYPTIGIILGYLVLVLYLGPRYMEKRPAYDCRMFIFFYNLFQIISCSLLVYNFFKNGAQWNFLYTCPNIVKDSPNLNVLLRLSYYAFLVKLAELVETVLFVLRKKQSQISVLHVYHHTSTLILLWLGLKFGEGGQILISLILNCIVHIVMYTYYLLAGIGPEMATRFQFAKKFITTFQLVQFVFIIINFIATYVTNCVEPTALLLLPLFFVPDVIVLFYFFSKFYRETYTNKSKENID